MLTNQQLKSTVNARASRLGSDENAKLLATMRTEMSNSAKTELLNLAGDICDVSIKLKTAVGETPDIDCKKKLEDALKGL